MAGNRFLPLIESGRVGNDAALKRAFRLCAKRLHPDLAAGSAPEDAARAFVALRAEYEEARAALASRAAAAHADEQAGRTAPAHGKGRKARVVYAWDRRVFYEKLEELMARGFPKKPRTAGPARFYEGSRKALLAYLAGRDGIYPKDAALEAFLDFENRLCAIPHGLEAREIYGTIPWRIHFFMSNLIGYHHSGFRHEAKAALSMLPEIEAAFRSHGDGDTIAFLHVLEADLDRGPAMLEQ